MILPFARVFAASCASTLTACAVLWGGGNHVVEISHAFEPVASVGAPTTTPGEMGGVTAAATATPIADPMTPPKLGLVLDGTTTTATGAETPVGRLQPCPYESNCVSSNYLEPPNRYVSPLKTFRDRETAFTRAVRNLRDESSTGSLSSSTNIKVVEILPRQYYIHATVPGTSAGSLDDVEILFVDNNDGADDGGEGGGGIVHLRCLARVTLPPPPFCLKKNCINGNMDQRTRIDRMARTLGLPPADRERMEQSAKWTPIFFNSDRVPGFDDEV